MGEQDGPPGERAEQQPSTAAEALPEFLAILERSSLRDGLRLVARLTGSGVGIRELVLNLLAPAQVEVGQRWASARWSVVQEHAATAIVEAALTGAVARVTGGAAPSAAGDEPPVVLACVDEEWHSLAARMAAEVLRADGLPLLYLGASLPAEDLAEYLAGVQPRAMLLSASMPTGLLAAREAVTAAHSANVPVIAGGSAFGRDDRRARAIGADGWAGDVDGCQQLLSQWAIQPPALSAQPAPDDEVARLLQLPAGATAAMQQTLVRRRQRMIAFNPALGERLGKDLAWLVQHAAAALTVDDQRVLDDYGSWLEQVLTARHVPGDVVGDMFDVVAGTLPDDVPQAKQWLIEVSARYGPAEASPAGAKA